MRKVVVIFEFGGIIFEFGVNGEHGFGSWYHANYDLAGFTPAIDRASSTGLFRDRTGRTGIF